MKILEFFKKNTTMTLVMVAYVLLFIFNFNFGVKAVANSGYYIKEMLMIMPVVFLLTALLDTWVPRETIMKYLGKESKMKGTIFSFLLGSISAGPIYAAFPICVLLLRKGATVKNIVIILSSWAVIKIPMLINEVAFLGFKFMAIRWVLTIIAILIFSYITNMIVKRDDMPLEENTDSFTIKINEKSCIGCGLCAKKYPSSFEIVNKKACVVSRSIDLTDENKLTEMQKICPMKAITF